MGKNQDPGYTSRIRNTGNSKHEGNGITTHNSINASNSRNESNNRTANTVGMPVNAGTLMF
jgi:hypothetical protein